MRPARRSAPVLHVLAAILLATLAGCAGKHGSVRMDARVGDSFDVGQMLPGHRYYTTGSEAGPDAILALREDRPLRSNAWRQVTMSSDMLVRLTDRMRGTRVEGANGHVVLDDRGERIGAWYSFFPPMPVTLLDDGGVEIAPPFRTPQDGPGTGKGRD